ncbi:hypothetical protein GTR02_01930 [Kineococcus sp. R8]|uniref:hypothetical protein n=1 Tax=Kineococcus siccus TaxID=2696567 RepID=UPI0014127C1C|nr:hypothetical protein [Kineococcus siccus]NAZ80578.1 hypothetical protein [Kineococcus siccus]
MRRVILQPAGNAGARKHYADTIATPVPLQENAQLLGVDYQSLVKLYPSGAAPLWGATTGEKDINVGRYDRMSTGDYVMFAAEGRIFRGGTVTRKFRNAGLATKLWGTDDRNRTWELMFAVDELRHFDLPYADFNQIVGYKANNVIQGFSVLDETRSALLFDQLSLDSDTYPSTPTVGALQNLLAGLKGETEREVKGVQRLEQGLLRRHLLPSLEGRCDLCGRDFPAQMLIAAHIKKRAACSTWERLDIPAIAMLACKFGCDSLFEEGYISVDTAGSILISDLAQPSTALDAYLNMLAGRKCSAWRPDRAAYFGWHFNHTFKMSLA